MAMYMIGYDLNKEKKYAKLIEAIKGISGYWCHPLGSTWLVKSSMSEVEIRDKLLLQMDADDELLVLKVSAAAWKALPPKASEWIKEHL